MTPATLLIAGVSLLTAVVLVVAVVMVVLIVAGPNSRRAHTRNPLSINASSTDQEVNT